VGKEFTASTKDGQPLEQIGEYYLLKEDFIPRRVIPYLLL
jgi:hypothetical protein